MEILRIFCITRETESPRLRSIVLTKRNAFRPKTVSEMYEAFLDAREDPKVGVVLLTGAGPHTDGKYAFCSGVIRAYEVRLAMWTMTECPV